MSNLTVYQLPGYWGLTSVSPFCLKLDSFLKMTGIPHKRKVVSTPFGGPKKKAPWINYKGKKMGDSTLIIDFLKNEFAVDPDADLTAAQRGEAVAVQRLLEENLYWAMVYDRWVRDENWPIMKDTVLGGIPAPARSAIAPMARRSLRKQLEGHGIGLHSRDEIAAIARKDISALAAILGDKPFMFGDTPTMADATAYSVLANITDTGFASPMKAMIAGHANLTSMLKNFAAIYYPAAPSHPAAGSVGEAPAQSRDAQSRELADA